MGERFKRLYLLTFIPLQKSSDTKTILTLVKHASKKIKIKMKKAKNLKCREVVLKKKM